MLFNTLNLIFLNVTMPNWTTKICAQISLAGLYLYGYGYTFIRLLVIRFQLELELESEMHTSRPATCNLNLQF